MDQLEALEVAKLAAMIGGELRTIDKAVTTPSSGPPANKLDLRKFKAQVVDPNFRAKPADYLTNVPEGFAAPLPEELIATQVPDVFPTYQPMQASSLSPNSVNLPHIVNPTPQQTRQSVQFHIGENNEKPLINRSDVDSIRNSLKNIDKSLAGLLNFFKNSKSNE